MVRLFSVRRNSDSSTETKNSSTVVNAKAIPILIDRSGLIIDSVNHSGYFPFVSYRILIFSPG